MKSALSRPAHHPARQRAHAPHPQHRCASVPYAALLAKADRELWLTGSEVEAKAILKPYPQGYLIAYQVSPESTARKMMMRH